MLWFALSLVAGIIVSEAFYGLPTWVYLALLAVFILAFSLTAAFKNSRKLFYIPLARICNIIR